jgi:hypothetical protein
VYYENHRLVGEPDTTIAVMLSSMAISNSKHQLALNSEYIKLIENEQLEILKQQLDVSNEVIRDIKIEAMAICKEVACSEKHVNFINSAVNN